MLEISVNRFMKTHYEQKLQLMTVLIDSSTKNCNSNTPKQTTADSVHIWIVQINQNVT